MKISILCPNLSSNAFGRAYMLYQMLEDDFDVEIIGPASDQGIWQPLRTLQNINVKPTRLRKMIREIDGDIVFASKPLLGSFGAGIISRIIKGKKLLLDIDDWQLGFVKHTYKTLSLKNKIKKLLIDFKRFHYIDSFWNCLLCEKMLFFAQGITVSNSFLKNRFGGQIIWHARDGDFFNPEKYNRDFLRKKHQIPKDEKLVLFMGTIRPHKGIEQLTHSINLIKDQKVKLLLINSSDNDYSLSLKKEAMALLGNRLILSGPISFEETPEFLSLADLYIIPQTESPASIGQMPAKLFDAMAMALPIISTDISDIPMILHECGWILKKSSAEDLAEAITHVFKNPSEARKRGEKARKVFLESFSLDIMKTDLINFIRENIK